MGCGTVATDPIQSDPIPVRCPKQFGSIIMPVTDAIRYKFMCCCCARMNDAMENNIRGPCREFAKYGHHSFHTVPRPRIASVLLASVLLMSVFSSCVYKLREDFSSDIHIPNE